MILSLTILSINKAIVGKVFICKRSVINGARSTFNLTNFVSRCFRANISRCLSTILQRIVESR